MDPIDAGWPHAGYSMEAMSAIDYSQPSFDLANLNASEPEINEPNTASGSLMLPEMLVRISTNEDAAAAVATGQSAQTLRQTVSSPYLLQQANTPSGEPTMPQPLVQKDIMQQPPCSQGAQGPHSNAQLREVFRRWQRADLDGQAKSIMDHEKQQIKVLIEQQLPEVPEAKRQDVKQQFCEHLKQKREEYLQKIRESQPSCFKQYLEGKQRASVVQTVPPTESAVEYSEAGPGTLQDFELAALLLEAIAAMQPESQPRIEGTNSTQVQSAAPNDLPFHPKNPHSCGTPWPPPIEDAEFNNWAATPQQDRNAALYKLEMTLYVDMVRTAHNLEPYNWFGI